MPRSKENGKNRWLREKIPFPTTYRSRLRRIHAFMHGFMMLGFRTGAARTRFRRCEVILPDRTQSLDAPHPRVDNLGIQGAPSSGGVAGTGKERMGVRGRFRR